MTGAARAWHSLLPPHMRSPMNSRSTAIITRLALVGLAGASSPSFAQPAKPAPSSGTPGATSPPEDPTVKARERFIDGVRFVKKKAWQAAYEAFRDAWRLKEHPQIALNLGRVEIEIGKQRDAIEHLQYWLEKSPPEDPDSVLARGWISEAKKKVATLRITVQGTGAEVRIDGQPVGTSPLPPEIYVDPGKHTVEVGKGTARDEVTVECQAGSTSEVKLTPKVAQAPAVASSSAPTVTAQTGDAPPAPRGELVLGGAVLGGVLVVTGAVFASVWASNAGLAAKEPRGAQCYDGSGYHPWCDDYHARRNDEGVFGNLSIGMFVGGVLVGGATLLYALRVLPPDSSPKKAAVFVVPVISPTTGGISVTAAF